MKTRNIIFSLAVTINMLFILPYLYAQELKPQDIYEMVNPAVMQLQAFDEDSLIQSWGSAVVVGDDGLVYTNMHIFKDAKWLKLINHTDTIYDIKIAGFEPDNDILILRIPKGIVRGVKLANSDSIKVGEPVYALGNPQGYINTFSNGQLSGVRIDERKQLQHTAPTSPGSSGGALLDSEGRLIGITSSYAKLGQNLNFAVPVNYYSNTAIVSESDTMQARLLKDVIGIYNSNSELNLDNILFRLNDFFLSRLSNRNAILTVAQIYYKHNENDCALNACEIGISKFPNDKQFYLLEGNIQQSKGKLDSALYFFNRSLGVDKSYSSALYARAFLYEYSYNDHYSAINDYRALLNSQYGNEYLYIYIAESYLNAKDTVNARLNLMKSYAYSGNDELIFSERGHLFSQLKMYPEAVIDFTSAIAIDQDNSFYYYSRAIANAKAGNHALTIPDYQKILSLNPNDATALSNLAYAYFNLSDYSEAEIDFRKAIALDEKKFDPLIGLSITLFKLNKFKESKVTMNDALKLKPVLEKGLSGLDSLKKLEYFWSPREINSIYEVFVSMRIEDSDMFAEFGADDQATESSPKPRENKMARSIK